MPEETICGYAVHPACAMLPMMSAASLAELADDIKANGQEQPVVVHRGLLLDGRNRLKACELVGVTPKVREWEGDDPVRWVLSLNFHRRHLTDSQKSIVGAHAADLLAERAAKRVEAENAAAPEVPEPVEAVSDDEATAEVPEGATETAEAIASMSLDASPSTPETPTKKPSQREIRRQARESAAALVNVSPQAIARGRKLIQEAVPELVGAVARGTVSLSQAARVAKLDSSQQRDLAARGDEAIVEEAVRMQKSRAAARPSTTKALADLDQLCAELTIRKTQSGEWAVEGRLQESDEVVSETAESLKGALTSAWTQARAAVEA